jgi:mannose-6-phosphate isomerase-like protein (cupin superfamily)
MTIRRIVTENVGGRSRVASDGLAPHTWCDEIWATTPQDPLGLDPGTHPKPLTPPPGATACRMVALPPDAVMRAGLARGSVEGVDPDGFHRTNTVDYVFVLDGPVELVLDDGSVVVGPGDCVVQRGTNHAWRNHGDAPIRLMTFMVGLS